MGGVCTRTGLTGLSAGVQCQTRRSTLTAANETLVTFKEPVGNIRGNIMTRLLSWILRECRGKVWMKLQRLYLHPVWNFPNKINATC